MKSELARLVVLESFRASSALGDLVPVLKAHLPSDEYASVSRAIAHCCAQIGLEVMEPLFAEHPDLKREIEERVRTYGRAF